MKYDKNCEALSSKAKICVLG